MALVGILAWQFILDKLWFYDKAQISWNMKDILRSTINGSCPLREINMNHRNVHSGNRIQIVMHNKHKVKGSDSNSMASVSIKIPGALHTNDKDKQLWVEY